MPRSQVLASTPVSSGASSHCLYCGTLQVKLSGRDRVQQKHARLQNHNLDGRASATVSEGYCCNS
jgi:hypothetical protein